MTGKSFVFCINYQIPALHIIFSKIQCSTYVYTLLQMFDSNMCMSPFYYPLAESCLKIIVLIPRGCLVKTEIAFNS